MTRSYWPGLFHCYGAPDLPRTNNDLEHLFGPARLVAATATRLRPFTGPDLAPADQAAWRHLRAELERRREARKQRCRFRRYPDAYLHQLEQFSQTTLPP